MDSDCGYFFLEADELVLCFSKPLAPEFKIRLDFEISGSDGKFKWSPNNDFIFQSSVKAPFKTENDADSQSCQYIIGLDNFFLKSTYFDLKTEVLQSFVNSTLYIKIVNTAPASAAPSQPPAKGAKAPAAAAVPAEELIAVVSLPLSALTTAKGSLVKFESFVNEHSSNRISNQDLLPEECKFVWRISGDNDLAEYLLGSTQFQITSCSVLSPPSGFALHYNDIIDPKAKVPATPAELRNKYLENIAKFVSTQESIANYSLIINEAPSSTSNNEESEASGDNEMLSSFLPSNILVSKGQIHFDKDAAASIPAEDNIREETSLWKITWPTSSKVFIHRNMKKKWISLISNSSLNRIDGKIVKSPLPESAALEGSQEIQLYFSFSFPELLNPGAQSVSITAFVSSPRNESSSINESRPPVVLLEAGLNAPLVPASPSIAPTPRRPADVVSAKALSSDSSRNVLRELNEEIASTIRQIASEYVALYPISLTGDDSDSSASKTANNSSNAPATLSDRKAGFLHYLSSSGVYHSLKEKLKPRIQRIVVEKFGRKAQALGHSESLKNMNQTNGVTYNASGDRNEEEGLSEEVHDPSSVMSSQSSYAVEMEALLAELYVHLTKQCNLVLNSLYTSTVIDRQEKETQGERYVNDSQELPPQKLKRLYWQACDAEADQRGEVAEQFHLERIQLLNREASLVASPETVHQVYSDYGEFCLRQSTLLSRARLGRSNADISQAKELFDRGREALAMALSQSKHWKTGLLYACVLVEFEQYDRAESLLNSVIAQQSLDTSQTDILQNFEGYESDKICPIDPLCYGILAGFYSLLKNPLRARKALKLANRSFTESNAQPHVSLHGSPKRTLVFVLSQTCLYLSSYGLTHLATECSKLALQSEEAVTAKAQGLGRASATVPFIRHSLKRGLAAAQMTCDVIKTSMKGLPMDDNNYVSEVLKRSTDLLMESIEAADSREDQIQGYLDLFWVQYRSNTDPHIQLNTLLEAVKLTLPIAEDPEDLSPLISLDAYIQLIRLLIQTGRIKDAYAIGINACRVNSSLSATLMLLVGVCCIRLEQWRDAEDALVEANLLDNRNAEIWCYLSLYCMLSSSHRLEEAERALYQAIRLDCRNSTLLRELSTAFIAVDRLSVAEDLIRRAMAIEVSSNESSKANPVTRKIFADILRGQNQAVSAIEEYREVIADSRADNVLRIVAAEKCLALLESLGRIEDIKSVKRILEDLRSQ